MRLQLGRLLLKHLIFILINHLNQWSLILLNQDLKTSLTEAESSLSPVSRPNSQSRYLAWPGFPFRIPAPLSSPARIQFAYRDTARRLFLPLRNKKLKKPTKQKTKHQKNQPNKKTSIFIISLSAHKWCLIQILALFPLQWQINLNCYRLVVAGAC